MLRGVGDGWLAELGYSNMALELSGIASRDGPLRKGTRGQADEG